MRIFSLRILRQASDCKYACVDCANAQRASVPPWHLRNRVSLSQFSHATVNPASFPIPTIRRVRRSMMLRGRSASLQITKHRRTKNVVSELPARQRRGLRRSRSHGPGSCAIRCDQQSDTNAATANTAAQPAAAKSADADQSAAAKPSADAALGRSDEDPGAGLDRRHRRLDAEQPPDALDRRWSELDLAHWPHPLRYGRLSLVQPAIAQNRHARSQ